MALLQKAYLGSTPLFREQSWFEGDAFNPIDSSSSVTVTADATAHVKGSWSELIASTSGDASLVQILVRNINVNNTNTATLIDIGTGASGSETAIISNVAVGGAATDGLNTPNALCFLVPIKVASGTRISARTQAVIASDTAVVQVFVYDLGDYSFGNSSVDVLGTDSTTSKGTTMSGSSGWVEVVASTSTAYRGVVVVPSLSGTAGNNALGQSYKLGIGPSGSEIVIGTAVFSTGQSEFVGTSPLENNGFLIGAAIPSGTRLAIEHALGGNAANYGVTLIGIP